MRFTDKQFFDWEIKHGLYPGGHNKGFYDVHHKLAMFILQHKAGYIYSHLDLGGGNSPLTKILQDHGVNAILVDTNKYSTRLQLQYGTKNIKGLDFTKPNFFIDLEDPGCQDDCEIIDYKLFYDFITSIEVFEHIEDSKLLPFISTLADHCEYFLFSSTPHKDTPEFDEQWGHVNIKPTNEWIKIFTDAGFEYMEVISMYLQTECIPTNWTLMFKSLKHA